MFKSHKKFFSYVLTLLSVSTCNISGPSVRSMDLKLIQDQGIVKSIIETKTGLDTSAFKLFYRADVINMYVEYGMLDKSTELNKTIQGVKELKEYYKKEFTENDWPNFQSMLNNCSNADQITKLCNDMNNQLSDIKQKISAYSTELETTWSKYEEVFTPGVSVRSMDPKLIQNQKIVKSIIETKTDLDTSTSELFHRADVINESVGRWELNRSAKLDETIRGVKKLKEYYKKEFTDKEWPTFQSMLNNCSKENQITILCAKMHNRLSDIKQKISAYSTELEPTWRKYKEKSTLSWGNITKLNQLNQNRNAVTKIITTSEKELQSFKDKNSDPDGSKSLNLEKKIEEKKKVLTTIDNDRNDLLLPDWIRPLKDIADQPPALKERIDYLVSLDGKDLNTAMVDVNRELDDLAHAMANPDENPLVKRMNHLQAQLNNPYVIYQSEYPNSQHLDYNDKLKSEIKKIRYSLDHPFSKNAELEAKKRLLKGLIDHQTDLKDEILRFKKQLCCANLDSAKKELAKLEQPVRLRFSLPPTPEEKQRLLDDFDNNIRAYDKEKNELLLQLSTLDKQLFDLSEKNSKPSEKNSKPAANIPPEIAEKIKWLKEKQDKVLSKYHKLSENTSLNERNRSNMLDTALGCHQKDLFKAAKLRSRISYLTDQIRLLDEEIEARENLDPHDKQTKPIPKINPENDQDKSWLSNLNLPTKAEFNTKIEKLSPELWNKSLDGIPFSLDDNGLPVEINITEDSPISYKKRLFCSTYSALSSFYWGDKNTAPLPWAWNSVSSTVKQALRDVDWVNSGIFVNPWVVQPNTQCYDKLSRAWAYSLLSKVLKQNIVSEFQKYPFEKTQCEKMNSYIDQVLKNLNSFMSLCAVGFVMVGRIPVLCASRKSMNFKTYYNLPAEQQKTIYNHNKFPITVRDLVRGLPIDHFKADRLSNMIFANCFPEGNNLVSFLLSVKSFIDADPFMAILENLKCKNNYKFPSMCKTELKRSNLSPVLAVRKLSTDGVFTNPSNLTLVYRDLCKINSEMHALFDAWSGSWNNDLLSENGKHMKDMVWCAPGLSAYWEIKQ